jgi:hypothetical protein
VLGMLGQMLHGHQPVIRLFGQLKHGRQNPTFSVGYIYIRRQPAQMQPVTGNG